jgi:hypothetical protein
MKRDARSNAGCYGLSGALSGCELPAQCGGSSLLGEGLTALDHRGARNRPTFLHDELELDRGVAFGALWIRHIGAALCNRWDEIWGLLRADARTRQPERQADSGRAKKEGHTVARFAPYSPGPSISFIAI